MRNPTSRKIFNYLDILYISNPPNHFLDEKLFYKTEGIPDTIGKMRGKCWAQWVSKAGLCTHWGFCTSAPVSGAFLSLRNISDYYMA